MYRCSKALIAVGTKHVRSIHRIKRQQHVTCVSRAYTIARHCDTDANNDVHCVCSQCQWRHVALTRLALHQGLRASRVHEQL